MITTTFPTLKVFNNGVFLNDLPLACTSVKVANDPEHDDLLIATLEITVSEVEIEVAE